MDILIRKSSLPSSRISLTACIFLQTRNQNLKKQKTQSRFTSVIGDMKVIGSGIGISGGALSGILAIDMEDIEMIRKKDPREKIILARPDTVPDDIPLIFNCDGLVTAKGGATSHAAVTAASLGKVCIVSCKSLVVDDVKKRCSVNGSNYAPGDKISIDGSLGLLYEGAYETRSE